MESLGLVHSVLQFCTHGAIALIALVQFLLLNPLKCLL